MTVEKVTPVKVTAFRQVDDTVRARVSVADGHLAGEVEYAFYLLSNSERIATRWYSKSAEVVFESGDVKDRTQLEVTGFVRQVSDHKKIHSKRVPIEGTALVTLQRNRRRVVGSAVGLGLVGIVAMAILYARGVFDPSTAMALAASTIVWVGIAWLVNRVMNRNERQLVERAHVNAVSDGR